MATLHGKQGDVILDGSQRPKSVYTRDNVMSRGFSPIIGDPTMLPPQTSDPLSRQEIEHLNAVNIRLDDKPLGAGQHAIIYSGYFKDRATQQTVHCAIKRSFNYRQAFAELEALQLFGKRMLHKNIIFFYGFYRSDIRMYLFIELSKMGDLSHYLSSDYGSRGITENEMYHLIRHIRNGIFYMHKNGYAHRDIKIHNILVFHRDRRSSRKDVAKVVCKLCDFGSTRRYNSGDVSRTVIGSPKTMAPEVSDTPYNAFMADVYSLGVILYQLSHDGNYPFESQESHSNSNAPEVVSSYAKHKRNPMNIKWSHSLTQPLKELLMKMLEPDPNRRIHLKDIYRSNWIQHHRRSGSSRPYQHQYREDSYSSGSETESESDSESNSDHRDTRNAPKKRGGRYRQARHERLEANKSAKSAHSGSGSDYTVRSDLTEKKSAHQTHHNPTLDRNPYASGKSVTRHGPNSFFEQ